MGSSERRLSPNGKRNKLEKAPSGIWYIDQKTQQAQYLNILNKACLEPDVKEFLRVIASIATWRKTDSKTGETLPESYTPCYASNDTLAIAMSRSPSYVQKAKAKAQELGWIKYSHSPQHMSSDWIWPVVGEEDPNFKQHVKREKPRVMIGKDDIKPISTPIQYVPNSDT